MQKKSIACIAWKNNKVLIAHRNPTGQMGGRWEFPGGKVEIGETPQQAIIREMQEEFGVKVEPRQKITQASFFHNKEPVTLEVYLVDFPHTGVAPDPVFVLSEHTGYTWVNFEEIRGLNFVDSDLMVLPIIKHYVKNL